MELVELFDEVRHMDVSDPSAFDRVLAYYEESYNEADEYMELLTNVLSYATITWTQPWYQESFCLTRPLKDEECYHEKDYNTGTFTKDEIKLVEKNWCMFVEEYNVPNKLICVAKWRNKTRSLVKKEKARKFVIAYLAKGLQRSLYQVNKFIISHYGGCNSQSRSHFSEDEKKVLDICFHHEPKQAVLMASFVLSRQSRRIYIKLHETFQGKPLQGKTKWTLHRATKLVKLIMDNSGESLEGLRNKKIKMEVWEKLEQEFNKPKEYLRRFWNTRLYSQLFVKSSFSLRRLQRKIFKV